MADFFTTLERMSPSSGTSGLPEWFSTHPNPVDRIGAVRRKTAEWQQKLAGQTFVANQEQYLAQVDGMVFGDDPRQGYVDAQSFYHPTLKFVLPVPSKWSVNNAPSQLQYVSPNEDAAIMLTAESGDTPQKAAGAFVEQSKASVQKSDAISVNGLPAQRLVSTVITDADTLAVMSYFIKKDNMIYTLHGITAPTSYNSYATSFSNVMGQFKTLTDVKRMQVKPTLLSVTASKTAGTLAAVLRTSGVKEAELETMAILNGKKIGGRPVHAQQVETRRQVKTIAKVMRKSG